jgi:hypothetical protein
MGFKPLHEEFKPLHSGSTGRWEEKKDAWRTQTVDELMAQGFSPTASGLLRTGQQLAPPLARGINTALGGVPDLALRKAGLQIPKTDIQIGQKDISKELDTIAKATGFVKGLPMAIGSKAASLLPKAGAAMKSAVGSGALQGATKFGIASALSPAEGEFQNWKQRGAMGLGGVAVGGAIGGVGGLVNHFTGLLSEPSQRATSRELRGSFKGFKGKLNSWFGNRITELQKRFPDKRVDFSEPIKDLKSQIGRGLKGIAKQSPRLQKAISGNKQLTLRESQDLINEVKSTIPKSQLKGLNVRTPQGERIGFVDALQEAKRSAFPQFTAVDKVWEKLDTYVDSVQNIMSYAKTSVGLKSVMKNPEQKHALKTVLPPELFDKALALSKAQALSKDAWKIVESLFRYAVIYGFVRQLSSAVQGIGDTGGSDAPTQ